MAAALPAVELFSTSILSNHAVRKRHERYTSVLTIKKIPYVYHDMASDEDAKQRWRSKARDPTIPGLLVHNEWRGTFAEFEEAVEFNELDLFLAIDHERLKREQAILAGANGPSEDASASASNGNAAAGDKANGASATNGDDSSAVAAAAAAAEKPAPSKYYGDAPPPFAPEGSGKRRSLNADDFLKALGIDESSLAVDDAELAELLNDSSLRKANEASAAQLGTSGSKDAHNGLLSNAARGIGAGAAARNAERKAQRAQMDAEQLKREGLGPLAEGAPVELFTTSLLSNSGVRQRHERFLEVLTSYQIHFRKYDLVQDDDAKTRWRARTRDPQLPGILVHGEWRGSFAEFDAAANAGPEALARWLDIDARLADASVRAASAAQADRAKANGAAAADADADALLEEKDASTGALGTNKSNRFSLAVDDFLASLGVADLKLDDADVDQLLNGEGVPDVPGGAGAAVTPLRLAAAATKPAKAAPEPVQSTIQEENEPDEAEAAAAEVAEEAKEEPESSVAGPSEAATDADEVSAPADAEVEKAPDVADDSNKVVQSDEAVEGLTEGADHTAPVPTDLEAELAEAATQKEPAADPVEEIKAEEPPAAVEAVADEAVDDNKTKTEEAVPVAVEPPVAETEPSEEAPTAAETIAETSTAVPAEAEAAADADANAEADGSVLREEEPDSEAVPEVPDKEGEKDLPVPDESFATTESTEPSTAAAFPTESASGTVRKPRKSKSRANTTLVSIDPEEDEVSMGRRGMDFQRPTAYALEPSSSLSALSASGPESNGGGGISMMPRSVSTGSGLSSSGNRSGSGSTKKGLGSRLSSMKFGKDRSASGSAGAGAGENGGEGSSPLRSRASREGLFKSRSRSPASAGRFKSTGAAPPMPALPRTLSSGGGGGGGVGKSVRAERTLSQILRDADEAMRSADAQMAGGDADSSGAGRSSAAAGDGLVEAGSVGSGNDDGGDGLDDEDDGDALPGQARAPDPFGEDQVKVGT